MTKNGSASEIGLSQFGELIAVVSRLLAKIVKGFTSSAIQKIIERPAELETALTEVLKVLIVKATVLLEEVGLVNIPATQEFIVKDHFTTYCKEVKIGCIDGNFKEKFLSKVEEAQAESILRISKLKNDSSNQPILDELGSKAETTLTDLWFLLKKQGWGQKGVLLTNGFWNMFDIRDAKGTLWTVGVYWRNDDWSVYAISVASPYEWRAGSRVFSHNS